MQRGSLTRDVVNDSRKVEIASYSGEHFVAEREGDELKVYMLVDDNGMPGVVNDSLSLSELQRRDRLRKDAVRASLDHRGGELRTLADINNRNRARPDVRRG